MNSAEISKIFWQLYQVYKNEKMGKEETTSVSKALNVLNLLSVRKQAAEESIFFRICRKCKTEIDLRKKDSIPLSDGLFVHKICPAMKPHEERDF